MKKIFLTKGKHTLVDDQDFEYLNQWKWYVSFAGYATRTVQQNKKVLLHRQLLGLKEGEKEVDHINRNPLDNRRGNLRIATRTQNLLNRGIYKNNKSGLKGVSWKAATKRWRVTFRGAHLGYFDSKEEAHNIYSVALGGV